MTSPQFRPRTHRARSILEAVGRAYPHAWSQVQAMRDERGRALPLWPDWCYLPLHGAHAIVSGDSGVPFSAPFDRLHHSAIVAALAAWRMGQHVVRYDPALYGPMIETPIAGDIPTSLLYRMPAWCLYVETPHGVRWGQREIVGFFAHLEWDMRGPPELRLLLDPGGDDDPLAIGMGSLQPVPLILGDGTLADAVERLRQSAVAEAPKLAHLLDAKHGWDIVARALQPMLSLILYLCSERPDWSGEGPRNPDPKRTRRHGLRLYPADKIAVWDVGVRLGASLRRAYEAEQTGAQGGTHASPRAHVRRPHWHGFWSGPRDGDRRFDVRWMPPIPVGVRDLDELPTVVHVER